MDFNKIGPVRGPGVVRYTGAVRKPAGAAALSNADKVDFSESGRLFAQALKAAQEAPAVRAGLVEEIKARVQNGTYQVDSAALAAKMLALGIERD